MVTTSHAAIETERNWIGSLLGFSLQTYMNNLAMKQRSVTLINYRPWPAYLPIESGSA